MNGKHLLYKYFFDWAEVNKKNQVRKVTYQKFLTYGKYLKQKYPTLYVEDITRTEYQKIINIYGDSHTYVTTSSFRRVVTCVLKQATYDGLLKKDPTYNVITQSTVKKKEINKFLDEDEIKRLLSVLKKQENVFSLMIEFDLRTGLRLSELLGLTLNDINFLNHTISINKTYDYKFLSGFVNTKNESSKRIVKIDNKAEEILKNMAKGLLPTESIFFKAYNNFRIEKGLTLNKGGVIDIAVNFRLMKYCKQAHIPVISFHKLRHTHASLLIAHGVSVHAVAGRLGHANPTTTMRVYVHQFKSAKEEELEKAREILRKIS